MQQFCKYGSVRGAAGNRRPYRDPAFFPGPISPHVANGSGPGRMAAGDRASPFRPHDLPLGDN
jgi:hypothetical protein